MPNAKNRIALFMMLAALAALLAARPAAAQGIEGKVVSGDPAPVAPPISTDPNELGITLQIFRIRGNISGDTSLTDDIWAGKPPKSEESKSVAFFNKAKLTVAGHRLEVEAGAWVWDGKTLPLGSGIMPPIGDNVLLIASPFVRVRDGETAEVNLSSDQPLEYFVHTGNGLYQLKKTRLSEPTGISLKLPIRREAGDRLHLAGLVLTTRMVEARKPLEGTTLNVGEPVIKTRDLKLDMHLRRGYEYGFLYFTGDGQGTLLVRLRVNQPAPGAPGQGTGKK